MSILTNVQNYIIKEILSSNYLIMLYIMGQVCSIQPQQISRNQLEQIRHQKQYQKENIQWSRDLNARQDSRNKLYEVPKVSQLKIKTLTDKNLESDSMIQTRQGKGAIAIITGLDYFRQFVTLKELIQSKQALDQIEQDQQKDQLLDSSLDGFMNNQDIGKSLNMYVRKQKVFQRAQINIQDFVRISEQPITQFYDFKEKIGEGGFGNVYRAICKTSNQERAIKVLKKKQMSKQCKKQFLAQMELLSKLDHPNIIKVYQLYYYNSFYYVVTEYCKGGTILDYINENSNYGQKFVSKIIKQILSALLYLHQNLTVHLDVKLQNVVFLEKFRSQGEKVYIKLIDFGCSRQFVPFKKKKGKISGTLSYIAPQCLKGYYSQKCDIWSAGVLLHILLSGTSPFKGKDEKQTMKNIQKKQINLYSKHWQRISQPSKQLIFQMLNRNPSKRISAKDALHHPWFNEMNKSKSMVMSKDVLRSLQRYYRGNNLVTIIQTFISLRKVNQQQRKRLTDIFQAMDTDSSGTIQTDQLLQAYKMYFGSHDEAQIKYIINKIDFNKSNSINFNEFLIAMSDRKNIFEIQHLTEAFNYFDADKTGFLERGELKQILKRCEKQEFQFILKQLDKDGDQKISKQQFVNYLIEF